MLRSFRLNNLEKRSNEATRVKINFRANPRPKDCLWKIATNIDEALQVCKISDGNMEGEYVVYLNAKLQEIIFEVTNELGTSKLLYRPNNSTPKELSSAGTNSTVVGLVVFFLILILSISLFIFKRRQRQKIFRNPDLTVENQILEHLTDETSVSQSNPNESCRCNQQKSELPPPSYSTLNVNENNESSDQVFVENSFVQPSDVNSELKPDEELESEEKRLSAYSSFLRSKSREDIGPSKSYRLTLFKSGDYDP